MNATPKTQDKPKVKAKAQMKVTLIKSLIGRKPKHRATVKGLGLRKINHTVVLEDTACTRGMVNQVSYLVKVQPVS